MLIKSNKETFFHFYEVMLYPGVNEISVELWAQMKSHPMTIKMIEDGTFEAETDEEIEVSAEDALVGLKLTQAKKLIKETVKLEVLRKWEAMPVLDENDAKIKKEVLAQIKKVTVDSFKPGANSTGKSYVDTGKGVETIEVSVTPSSIDD